MVRESKTRVIRRDSWLERQISLRDKHKLHMRPAQRLVETASRFGSEIRAVKDQLDMNAKSLVDMIEFAAYMVKRTAQDDNEFTLRARGADAREALKALEELVNQRFGLD
jgi:phosphotransferase system HPr (HPr) family protein